MADEDCHWALREWSAVCAALLSGASVCIARKGGIHEPRGGLFPLPGSLIAGSTRHIPQRFALLPGQFHQQAQRLAPWWAARWQAEHSAAQDNADLLFPGWAEVAACWLLSDAQEVTAFSQVEGAAPLSQEELLTRLRYRDQPWLAVMSLRVWRWPSPQHLPNSPQYRGCRSWIPLQAALPCADPVPVLDDGEWRRMHQQVAAAVPTAPCFCNERILCP